MIRAWPWRSWMRRVRARWPEIFLALVPVAVIGAWFRQGNFVYFIDNYFPFNPPADLGQFGYAWSDYNGVGTLNVTNFPLIPLILVVGLFHNVLLLPLWFSQALLYYSILGAGALFMFWLVRRISFVDGPTATFAGLSASLFYLFNPVFLDLYWYLNFPGAAGLFVGLPALLYFLVRGFQAARTDRLDRGAILGAGLASVFAATSEVPYIASAVLVAVPFLAYFLLSRSPSRVAARRRLAFLALSAAAIATLNLFWWLPELLVTSYASGPGSYSTGYDLAILTGNSALASPWSTLTLTYFPLSNSFALWHPLYSEAGLSSVLLPAAAAAIAFASALWVRSRPSPLRHGSLVLGLLAGWLFTAALLMGNNPSNPLRDVYLAAFNSSLLAQAFLRGPYLTWGAGMAVFSSVTFGVGAGGLALFLRRHVVPSGRADLTLANVPTSASRRWRVRSWTPPASVPMAFVVLALVAGEGWPYWSGATVRALDEPATPVFPPATYDLAGFLSANQGLNTSFVYPATNNLVADSWPGGGYVGPPFLGFMTGRPTIQYVGPPIGTRPNDVLSLAAALPPNNASGEYSRLYALIGVHYVVLDTYSVANPIASWANLSTTSWSLQHQSGLTRVGTIGGYQVYSTTARNPILYRADQVLTGNQTVGPGFVLGRNYSRSAANNTDESTAGFFTSSAAIVNASPRAFTITEYWPSLVEREQHGTGFHYPGWPEIVNSVPIDLRVGNFPYLTLDLNLSGNATPIVAFSSVPVLKVLPNDPDRTLQQFFSAPIVSSTHDTGPGQYRIVYDLASPATLAAIPDGVVRHILIQLQPGNGYAGYINGTVRLTAGSSTFALPTFHPVGTALIPDGVRSSVRRLSASTVSFHRIDPTHFHVDVAGNNGSTLLVFLQEYDPHWTLTVSGGGVSAFHFVADDFANGWLLNSSRSEFSMELAFSLQGLVPASQVVSVGSLAALVAVVARPWRPGVVRRLRALGARLSRAPTSSPPTEAPR
ncbi:MAG: hypothetical protein L3K23_02545 [Thermoplasmata archaeon]|nr:hypothetical protein [Thermoplasmata archaeon]